MLLNEVMNVLKDVSEMVSLFSEEISESMKGVENYIFEEIEEKFDIKQTKILFILSEVKHLPVNEIIETFFSCGEDIRITCNKLNLSKEEEDLICNLQFAI